MKTVEEALALIKEFSLTPSTERRTVDGDIVGYVLAEDIIAPESVPAFRASTVDGYAICVPSSGMFEKGIYPVAFASVAQVGKVHELKEGQIARITTGAPLPPGSNAVVMVEDTVVKSFTTDRKEETEVEILTSETEKGENVREVGSDVQKGTIIMHKGEGVSAVGGELGLLASVGIQNVLVYKKPIVGVLSTGDEIIEHIDVSPGELKLGQVRDTNRPTLITAIEATGFKAVDLGIATDKWVEI
jgi:gephyrin